jgi:alpha-L-fucosidase
VGRGASLLLSVPPDRRGRVHESDERSLRGSKALLDARFGRDRARGATATASHVRGGDDHFSPARVLDGDRDTYWSTDDDATPPQLVLDLARPVTIRDSVDAVRMRLF